MKKTASRILALALMASLILSGCGSTGTGENTQANNEKPASGESSAENQKEKVLYRANQLPTLLSPRLQPPNFPPSTCSIRKHPLTLSI